MVVKVSAYTIMEFHSTCSKSSSPHRNFSWKSQFTNLVCERTVTDFEVLYKCPCILSSIGCGFEVVVEPL